MIHIHEQWNTSLDGYDIALLIFDDRQNVTDFTDNDLPSLEERLEDDEACCTNGDELETIGYGRNATDGVDTDTLKHTSFYYANMSLCTDLLWESYELLNNLSIGTILRNLTLFRQNGFVCAFGDNTDVCFGDPGGPLFTESWGDVTILGVFPLSIHYSQCRFCQVKHCLHC